MKTNKIFYLPKVKYIQLLHIAKSKLDLTDDEYVAVLDGITGKYSSKHMNLAELDACLKRFKELGFTLEKQKNPNGLIKDISKQHKMILALWNEIKANPKFRNKSADVMGFLQTWKVTEADNIKHLKSSEASRAIEILKKYSKRLEV